MAKMKHNGFIPPKPRKHTTIKVIVIASMFFLMFSTIGATVMYLGNNPALQPTLSGNFLTGASTTGLQQGTPEEDTIIPGLGALNDKKTDTETGSSATGNAKTGTGLNAATGSTSTGSK